MKQAERASIMRIVADLIKADGIIDTREISFLETLREKYTIKKEDEMLASSYTLSTALETLKESPKTLKHDLLGDFMHVAMSDDFCAREEALLLLALRTCLTINLGDNVSVLSIETGNLLFEPTQILYVESEYGKTVNQQISEHFREISAEVRLAGFDFVYLPKIAEHYRSIDEADILQIVEFLYPKVSKERLQIIIRQLQNLSTADFCKFQMAAKLNIRGFEFVEPSLLIKVGDSYVNDTKVANFLMVETGDDVLEKIRMITDLFAECFHNVSLNYLKEEKGRLIFTGIYKQVFDIFILRKGVKSMVVADTMREQIRFPEADVKLEGIHRREKALYTLFLLESPSGGISFNKPKSQKQYERYEKRMAALQTKYKLIYRRFGGDEAKAPDITIAEIRLPMISLLKRQILKLGDVLFHIEDYTIQRNIYGNYSVGIPASLCQYCEGKATEFTPFSESEEWLRISAL